jgi:hypothetical protein
MFTNRKQTIVAHVFVYVVFLFTGASLHAHEGNNSVNDPQILSEEYSHYPLMDGKRSVIEDNCEVSFDVKAAMPNSQSLVTGCSGTVEYLQTTEKTDWSRAGEFIVDTNIAYVPVTKTQENAAIAFDGTNYLAVWEDERCWAGSDIYGTRIDQSGNVLDPAGIPICTYKYNNTYPAIAFDGTNYLVVWLARHDGGATGDIMCTRVSTSGEVLDENNILVYSPAYYKGRPGVAFGGSNYLVVWTAYSDGRVYGARVSPSGTVLDPGGFVIAAAGSTTYQLHSSVTLCGENYLVVWQHGGSDYNIYGARVSPLGTVIDPAGIPISTAYGDQESPGIVSNGVASLVVWTDGRNSGYPDIYGARVGTDGTVLDPSGICIFSHLEEQADPDVSFSGTCYLVAWADRRNGYTYEIYGARVDTTGTVLDPSGIPIGPLSSWAYQYTPCVGTDNVNFFVAWEKSSGTQICGKRVNSSGTILDTTAIPLSDAAYCQDNSAAAFDGKNYLVVWQDNRTGPGQGSNIYGARIDTSGIVLDPSCISIATTAGSEHNPSVAFNGSQYLVVWQVDDYASANIIGTRVDTAGVVLDPSGISICTYQGFQGDPSASSDADRFMVVWEDSRGTDYDIYGARIEQSGTVIDPNGFQISTAADFQANPHVWFGSSQYLVTWDDTRDFDHHIYGARVTPAGAVLDPSGILICGAGYSQTPAAAFDGTNFLVAWHDIRGSDADIYGARVDTAGTVLDPGGFPICTAQSGQAHPSVAYDGHDYHVLWFDLRNGTDSDVYEAHVSTAGTVIDELPVSLESDNQIDPYAVSETDDYLLVAYTGFVDSINGQAANAMRIWAKSYRPEGLEEHLAYEVFPRNRELKVYPNPFTKMTNIRFDEEHSAQDVEIKIYDATGRCVKHFLLPTACSLLPTVVHWHGDDEQGVPLPTGVYMVRCSADQSTKTEKVLLVR